VLGPASLTRAHCRRSAAGTYAPSLPQNRDVNFYQGYLVSVAQNELQALNSTNYAAGAAFNATLNSTIGTLGRAISSLQSANRHYDPTDVRAVMDQVFQLFNSTVRTA
jgi:hypothetical protein